MGESVIKKHNRKTSWKKYQNTINIQKKVLLAAVTLILLASLVLFGKMTSFFTSSTTVGKNYSWDGSSNINLAVKGDIAYVLFFDPQNGTVTILKVADDIIVDLPFGFGKWSIRSVYQLGEAERPPIGDKLFKETLALNLAIPIDGYLRLEGKYQDYSLESLLGKLKNDPFEIFRLFKQVKSDLNSFEKVRLFLALKGVRSDKITTLDLEQSPVTRSILLPDGSRSLAIDEIRLDNLIQSKIKDIKLTDESKSVGIFNATGKAGLAQKAARMITNMGGRVVFTANSQSGFKKSYVLGESSYTKSRLAQIFAPLCLPPKLFILQVKLLSKRECDIKSDEILSSRAALNIILGEDYYDRFNRR